MPPSERSNCCYPVPKKPRFSRLWKVRRASPGLLLKPAAAHSPRLTLIPREQPPQPGGPARRRASRGRMLALPPVRRLRGAGALRRPLKSAPIYIARGPPSPGWRRRRRNPITLFLPGRAGSADDEIPSTKCSITSPSSPNHPPLMGEKKPETTTHEPQKTSRSATNTSRSYPQGFSFLALGPPDRKSSPFSQRVISNSTSRRSPSPLPAKPGRECKSPQLPFRPRGDGRASPAAAGTARLPPAGPAAPAWRAPVLAPRSK